jgi:2-hydroxy-6-oxonona-2,4-dienedioate hydrolase
MPSPSAGRTVLILAGLVAAGLPGLAYARYRHAIRQARERVSTGGRIAETACAPIEYSVMGDGPPLLLVHGAGGGYDQGLEFGVPLAGRGFRIIAMSRFGYLRTPLPGDASAAAQADAHAYLLDALGIERAGIVGASAGAPSTLQFALRHPERCSAMVLMVPAAYAPRAGGAPSLQTPPRIEFLLGTALKSDLLFWAATHIARNTLIRSILATPLSVMRNAGAPERARVNDVMEHLLPISARRLGLLNDAAVTSSLERYDLERIAVPTLVIGVADCLYGTFEPARYTAQHIPGARFVRYETGGHLWVGHQEEVVSEISAFLGERQLATRSH